MHAHFAPRFTDGSNAVDVELLVTGPERRPILVQARPIRIVWEDADPQPQSAGSGGCTLEPS